MIQTYNNKIKGTDLMDQLKVSHETDRKYSAKFYLRLIFDLLDIAFNSFIVYSKYMGNIFHTPEE